ncbi:MAG: hypothetical protein M1836_007927 [Candelina mexicana]|nr:MAG: hypothetical protein M1836_007927 [Candelina mexicana]
MTSTDNGDDGAQSGKPEIDHDKEITAVKDFEASITLTKQNFKALRSEVHDFVETHLDECGKTPRSLKKQSWISLVDRFVESEGKGDKFWDPTRDEFNSATHLSWPDDREEHVIPPERFVVIRFIVFCLLKKEAVTQHTKHRKSNAAELVDDDDNGGTAASSAPNPQPTKKRKENAVADSPTSPPATKKSRKSDNTTKGAGATPASDDDTMFSQDEEVEGTIEVRDHRDGPDFFAPVKAQHEKQVKAGASKPVSSARQSKGLFKTNAQESTTELSASKNSKTTSTPRTLSDADIEKSKFTSTKSGAGAGTEIGAKAALTSKKRAADGEALKEVPTAKVPSNGKKAKGGDDVKKPASTVKEDMTSSKGTDDNKSAAKAPATKKAKNSDQAEPKISSTTQNGDSHKKEAKCAPDTSKTMVTENKNENSKVPAVAAAEPQVQSVVQAHHNSLHSAPGADGGQVGDVNSPSVGLDTIALQLSISGPLQTLPATTVPILGGRANELNENQGLTTNYTKERDLGVGQEDRITAEEIGHHTSPALRSNPTPVRDISNEFSSTDFHHDGLKRSQGSATDSHPAIALANIEPFQMADEDNAEVLGVGAHRSITGEREMTRERSVGQPNPEELPKHANEAASSLLSPVNTLRSPTLTTNLHLLPPIIFTVDIETPSYQMPSSYMLSFPPTIDWATFYGRVVLELTGIDKHALTEAQSVKISSAALVKPIGFKVGAAAEVLWKRLMKRVAAAEEEEVEVCFQ